MTREVIAGRRSSRHRERVEHGGTIERYADAWQRGDLEAMLDAYSPDVVTHDGGTSPFAGDHHGREALVGILLETARRGNRQLLTVDAVHDADDHGAIFVTERFTIDDAPVTVDRCLRYRVDGDRIAETRLYDRQQHLVDQAWGSS